MDPPASIFDDFSWFLVTIETQARIKDHFVGSLNKFDTSDLAVLSLYDFFAAFPSIAHKFIFIILLAFNLPIGLYNFFVGLYSNNRCFGIINGDYFFLFNILAGIIQGCPASGSVFVLSVDGFLRLLVALDENSTTCAFADDIGQVISSLKIVDKFYRAFNFFRRASGLSLKIKKCVFIPLGKELTPLLEKQMREYISKIAPGWKDFNIKSAHEYLGFIIGPQGGNIASWQKAINNYNNATHSIATAKIAPSAGTMLYHTHALPRLSYIPQLCTPPANILRHEKHAIETILHIPHNTLPKDTPYACNQIGMKAFTPITLVAKATIARSALKTCKVWKEQFRQLEETRKELGPCALLADKTPSHGHRDSNRWATRAFVDNLNDAAQLKYPDPPPTTRKRLSLQAHIQKHIAQNHYEHSLAINVYPRIYKFLPPPLNFPKDALIASIENTNKVASKLPPSIGFAILKTWCNGWITDTRFNISHNPPCRLGCDPTVHGNNDRLKHYLSCPRLWKATFDTYRKVTATTIHHSVFNALCLIPPWSQTNDPEKHIRHLAFCLQIALDTYQSLSNHQKSTPSVANSPNNNRFQEITEEDLESYARDAARKLNALIKLPNLHPRKTTCERPSVVYSSAAQD